jgi:hypothetical protein
VEWLGFNHGKVDVRRRGRRVSTHNLFMYTWCVMLANRCDDFRHAGNAVVRNGIAPS